MKLSARDRPAPPGKASADPQPKRRPLPPAYFCPCKPDLVAGPGAFQEKPGAHSFESPIFAVSANQQGCLSAENANGEDGMGGRLWERAGRGLRAQPQIMTSVWDPGEAPHRAGGPRAGQQQAD